MLHKVIACIDDTPASGSVCDHAAWAAQRLQAPLELLHVLDHPPETPPLYDLSGRIGVEAQQALLEELAALDERRAQLLQERGHQLLEAARTQAEQAGVVPQQVRQRHGALVDALAGLEDEVRLFVVGPGHHHREGAAAGRLHLDHRLERVLRAVHRPVLVAAPGFRAPRRFLIAFDGSAAGREIVERVALSPLLRGLPAHLVMAGAPGAGGAPALDWARGWLASTGFAVESALLPGEPEAVIARYRKEHDIELLVMGAHGHSRIRQLVIGSTTSTLLRRSEAAVLVLR